MSSPQETVSTLPASNAQSDGRQMTYDARRKAQLPPPHPPPHPRARRKPEWSRHGLERFRRGLSQERQTADNENLAAAFALAAQAPIMRLALDWARENNVEFIIDQKMSEKVLGYYTPGTGVVAVAARLFDDESAAGKALLASVLTHEIRHAWQEANGISDFTLGKNSADYYILQALIEADAYAHEQLAKAQYLQGSAAAVNEPDFMWGKFREWYSVRNVVYGENAMNFIGSIKNIPGAHPKEFGAEFQGFGWMSGRSAINFNRPEELRRLGKSFAGKNYLDNAPREEFDRLFLSRGLARQFFDAARKPDAIAVALRKKELEDRRRDWKNEKTLREIKGGALAPGKRRLP